MSHESHGPALGAIWGCPKEESKCWEDCVDVNSARWKVSLFREWGPIINYKGLLGILKGPARVQWGMQNLGRDCKSPIGAR